MEYHKIQSLYKRDPSGKKMLFGEFSLPEFEYLSSNRWVFTEKVDGTNIRVIIRDGKVTFGGKTDNAQIPSKLYARLQERFLADGNPERLATKFPDGAILYGEGFGPGIQSGGNYRKDQDFVLFDVLVGNWWLKREDVKDVAVFCGVEVVPVLAVEPLCGLEDRCEKGFDSQWGKFVAEGIVARPEIELRDRAGNRIITKLKHKDFPRR